MKQEVDNIYEFKIKPMNELFYSEESNYGVYVFSTKEEMPKLYNNPTFQEGIYTGTMAGKMQRLEIGFEYDMQAKLDYNKKYNGWQYNPLRVTAPKLDNEDKTRIFLESIITKKQTDTLLKAYPNIVNMITEGKEVDLSITKGIKDATFNKIQKKVIDNYVMSDLIIMLRPLGISFNVIKKLIGNEPNPVLIKQKLIENPYVMTKIKGLGFKKVDALALKLNPNLKVSKHRAKSFINYILTEKSNSEGHTWISLKQLTNEIKSNLYECFELYKEVIIKEKEKSTFLHVNGNKVGLKKNYEIEKEIFQRLMDLENSKSNLNITDKDIEKGIAETELNLGFTLTEEQRNAIRSIKDHNVIVITAPAGAGKTVSVNGILHSTKRYTIQQTALSAKAAQRMKEVTGREAQTIHRTLNWTPKGFRFDENNKLDTDIIILDEASLVNASIFLSLLKAIKRGSKFIIVFDYAQLPPIGNGNIATDILESKFFNINKFTKIHRQAEKSGILLDANKIRQGVNPIDKLKTSITHGELKDMHYIFRNDRNSINDLIIESFMKALNTTSLDETVIIIPRKKNCQNSTYEINKKIQDLLLPNEKNYIKRGDMKFKKGTKVIQKINDYEKNVFNGEMGYINYIDSDKNFNIKFTNGKFVEYSRQDISNIELAYAITIHESQGSQWKTVIIGIDNTHWILLDSTLLYTAITRASDRCLLIAEPKAFKTCIDNNKSKVRKTYLRYFIEMYNKKNIIQ